MPRLSLFSPLLAVALTPRQLRALERRVAPLPPHDPSDPRTVARALFAYEVLGELADVLEEVERFATPLGREALVEAARALGVSEPSWRDAPPLDAALAVVLDARRGARGEEARRFLKRARVRIERYFSPHASYEITARTPAAVPREEALLRAGRAVYGASLVDAWFAEHGGVLYAAFLHEGPLEATVQRKDSTLVRRTRRPLRCDRVRCERRRERVGFQLARPALLPSWVAALGQALGDERWCLSRPAFTLRLLHERGAAWLRTVALPEPLRAVTVVGCELDDGTRFGVRSPNALGELHERLGSHGGYLVRVTLRFAWRAGETTDATIELPNKLTIADPRHEPAIRAALDALSFTAPGALPDDLPSLAPFEHASWRWIEVLGPSLFESCAARGLLARFQGSRRAADPAHRSYGSSLIVHELPGEEAKYALGEDLAVHAYDVPAEAAVRWKLDESRFVLQLAARLGLSEPRLKRRAPPGLLPIGRLKLQDTDACIFQQMRIVRDAEADGLREELRLACGAALPVLLVGRGGRPLGGGTAQVQVSVDRLFDDRELGEVLEGIADALGVDATIEGWRYGAPDRPLVLVRDRAEAWFGKVRLKITANQFGMLLGLARTPGEWVTSVELGERISVKAAIPDQVVRKARLGFAERIAQSFEEAGVPMPPGLPERILEADKAKGGYRLGVGVVVR